MALNPLDLFGIGLGSANLLTDLLNIGLTNQRAKGSNKILEQAQARDYELGLKQLESLENQNNQSNQIARENINMQKDLAMQNLGLQQNQFDYQKRLNQLTMEREDNAIQRQIADLTAAGFSPLMASSGSSAASLSSASAPQIDNSGISAAQGSYLSLAQQYSALKQETMSNIRNNASKNAQALASNKQGAAFALANLVQGAKQNINEAYWRTQNFRLNAERQDAEINRINEQIASSKQEREWMSTHGYRNQDLINVLIPILDNYLQGKSLSDIISNLKDTLQSISDNGYIKAGKEEVKDVIDSVVDEATDLGNKVKDKIQEAVDSVNPVTINTKESPTSKQISQAVENAKSKKEKQSMDYFDKKLLTYAANSLNIPNYSTIYYKVKKDRNGKYYVQFFDDYKIKPISDKMYSPEAVRREYNRIKHIGD